MSPQTSPSTSTQSLSCAPSTQHHSRSLSTHRPARRRSLRLPSQPINIPVPPSLLQSPYLNSPASIFQRAVSSPQHPSKEDEQWLQDTVPLSPSVRHDDKGRSSEMTHLTEPSSSEQLRGRSMVQRSIAHPPSLSPPLRWQNPSSPTPPPWLRETKAAPAPCMTGQGYFVTTA